jgi:hypothetical protein
MAEMPIGSKAFILLTAAALSWSGASARQERVATPSQERLAAIQAALGEALRLSHGCMAARPEPCAPEPPCDDKGRRTGGFDCVLVWKTVDGRERLAWAEQWEAEQYRLPVLDPDGSLR